ncbi:hypothetical protein, partial [Burkholderia sp. SIMBA_024]|uniref:hypothetical protein n=1 Tax=Burkholderia sp. SIMBA_024 TaxID=3085768 RepID=UPI00397994B6
MDSTLRTDLPSLFLTEYCRPSAEVGKLSKWLAAAGEWYDPCVSGPQMRAQLKRMKPQLDVGSEPAFRLP